MSASPFLLLLICIAASFAITWFALREWDKWKTSNTALQAALYACAMKDLADIDRRVSALEGKCEDKDP